MPRSYQAVKAPTGQAYGQAQDQQSAQKAIPLPRDPTTAGPSAQPGPDLLALAAQMGGGQPLNAPTQRPAEPVTAGLPIGPGAGPEALAGMFSMRRNQTADVLEQVAAATGDTRFLQMAQQARMRG